MGHKSYVLLCSKITSFPPRGSAKSPLAPSSQDLLGQTYPLTFVGCVHLRGGSYVIRFVRAKPLEGRRSENYSSTQTVKFMFLTVSVQKLLKIGMYFIIIM